MQYNFVIIRTAKGGIYARKILGSIKWLAKNKYPQHRFDTYDLTIEEFLNDEDRIIQRLEPHNTIIHARCANPRTAWTIKLRELQERGYKVVNSVDAIELTSDKLACSLTLQDKVFHPRTWEYSRDMSLAQFEDLILGIDETLNMPDFFIAKPLTSLEQGANVKKIALGDEYDFEEVRGIINEVPGKKVVIQEYIPYTALHRVIVIGGKALPFTFVDKPEWHKKGDWKVSCCLNRTTMQLNENASLNLLKLAEETQREVRGVINFIDIFEYVDNDGNVRYTNAEINTACSLNIHERLAKAAGRKDWNIHAAIARELVKSLLVK